MRESDIQRDQIKCCRMCNMEKAASEFNKSSENKDGLQSYCRMCSSQRNKQAYYKNQSATIERVKAWNSKNLDKVATNMRRCRSRNPEKYREIQRLRRRNNPKLVAVYDANKKAKRRAAISATINPITQQEWEAIKKSQNHKCIYCGKDDIALTMDHVVPLSKGGDHDKSNIVGACWLCNGKKTNLSVEEFIKRLQNERT
jgi:5-methylcytosine-specific restriction endonuclease McrA